LSLDLEAVQVGGPTNFETELARLTRGGSHAFCDFVEPAFLLPGLEDCAPRNTTSTRRSRVVPRVRDKWGASVVRAQSSRGVPARRHHDRPDS